MWLQDDLPPSRFSPDPNVVLLVLWCIMKDHNFLQENYPTQELLFVEFLKF